MAEMMETKFGIPWMKVNFIGGDSTAKALRKIGEYFEDEALIARIEEVIAEEMPAAPRRLICGRTAHPAALRTIARISTVLPRVGHRPTPWQREVGQAVAEAYGVLRNFGIMKLASRETFIIAPDGTVVARRTRVEQAQQDRLAQFAVQLDPPLDVTAEVLRPGDDQQGAGPRSRELGNRTHDQIDHSGSQGLRTTTQTPGADLFEEATQVLLKDHHHHDDQDGEEALEEPHRELELELLRRHVDAAEQQEPARRHHQPAPAAGDRVRQVAGRVVGQARRDRRPP